jgi:hypothetical protein
MAVLRTLALASALAAAAASCASPYVAGTD